MLRRVTDWLRATPRRRWITLGMLGFGLLIGLYGGYRVYRFVRALNDPRNQVFASWWTADQEQREALITTQQDACPGAPFILPTEGYIGLLYGDPRGPYSASRRHQGIDIFSPGGPGETPVYAAYDGYLTREANWVSSLILRVPEDPLQPDRQIWLYYTHMASASGEQDYIEDVFEPGTREVFVRQGTLLGYTGNYSGSARGVGVHLHFSIVLDDGSGHYRNELEFDNTVDPSRYLGLAVNFACAPIIPSCTPDLLCADAVLGAGGG